MPVIAIVLFCHFLTAFTALGMPLFLPRMLTSLGLADSGYLVGAMFVLPTVCTALTAPWWGRFADRFGKKTSLLRAQAGLVLGFLLSGFADSVWLFALGLMVQGVSGGTLAASNAYLSRLYGGKALAHSLNLTQCSARLALVCAPIVLGLFTHLSEPLQIYRALALLPLLALFICSFLPGDGEQAMPAADKADAPTRMQTEIGTGTGTAFSHLLWLQFLFCFAMVVTFPYFLPYSEQLGVGSDALSGFYYSLPHLVYLLLAFHTKKLSLSPQLQSRLGLGLLGISCLGQFLLPGSEGLLWLRLLFGLGIVLSYSGLHLLVSQSLNHKAAGLSFGRFDAWGKWAGVMAGLAASGVSQLGNLQWPFLLAALSCGAGLFVSMFSFKEVQDHACTVP
ncbi:MFS transporter [Shewanella sp. AS16]|uniref:MFS transporter n=1 Tax=Shewanella sp. AS16 TaxID=2907625 RepID=UPI001F2F9E7B|nr:MFS transporter [Shewanella sp. AS16]MCE9686864.1 MFS transporter [Shewanella sp. AS16]